MVEQLLFQLDLKKLINAKIALNKNEFSFYNQLLERLENIEKIDSSILNQILYKRLNHRKPQNPQADKNTQPTESVSYLINTTADDS